MSIICWWLTVLNCLMNNFKGLWYHGMILIFWKYHTFDTFKPFIWASWAFYCYLLKFMWLKVMRFFIIWIWLNKSNLNIVIIRSYLRKYNFGFIFGMIKPRRMRNIFHTVVNYLQRRLFMSQFNRLKLLT